MEKLLISACLLGERCRYDGLSNPLPDETIAALRGHYELLPVCPERDGGMPTPRIPSERRGSLVVNREGEDVTDFFVRGAEKAFALAETSGCKKALLKERSPSCGSEVIYDGSFSGTLVPGEGVTAERLRSVGIEVFGESRWKELL